MKVVKTLKELRSWRADCRLSWERVGFVPTMGALHEGHGALVVQSATENHRTVVSIFVNPTQFGPNEDLARYPRTLEADLKLCRERGADLVFVPEVETLYPEGADTWVDVGMVGNYWCGASRPGHFRGVSTVVTKLFLMVEPDKAYFGQKDAQQATLLLKMVRDLRFPLEMVVCPTVRESDGLAMSSRNRYLSESERTKSTALIRALEYGVAEFQKGESNASVLEAAMRAKVAEWAPEATVDYLGFADSLNFQPLPVVKLPCTVLGAIRLGKTRLIDNIPLGGP
jgi:pantoate--beta-alanine ligase